MTIHSMALLKFSNVPQELAQPTGMWVRLKKWPLGARRDCPGFPVPLLPTGDLV